MDAEIAPYWDAFAYLERDRDYISLGMGMAGGLLIPAKIKRPQIRREGRRRGYGGDALDDFVEIVVGFDDERCRVDTDRQVADAKAAASKKR